jgi:SAM-dependent methyltransferase
MTQEIGLYEDEWSAEVYDYHARSLGDLPFWQALAEESGGTAFELGCGTGRLLLPLARAGLRVTGLDLSPHMLAVAKRKLESEEPEAQARVCLMHGHMVHFSLDERFGLILIPSRNLQVLLSRHEQRACLECCMRHLRPHGRLAIDVFNPRLDWLSKPGGFDDGPDEFLGPDGATITHTAHTEADLANQTVASRWRYESRERGAKTAEHRYLIRLHYFFRFEMEWMLEACGFEVEALYGDFYRSPFASDSPETIFVARKGGGK